MDGSFSTDLMLSPADVGANVLQRVGLAPFAQRSTALRQAVTKAVANERALLQKERARATALQRQLQLTQVELAKYKKAYQQVRVQAANIAQQARRAGFKGASTLVPIDSGNALITGDGLTALFQISPGVAWRYLGLVVSEAVANTFVLNIFTVAGFPNISQGVNVSNNGANAGLGLGPFVFNSTSPMVLPFAGKTFGAQTPLTLQARSITSPLVSARFVAVVVLGLNIDGVCDPATAALYQQQR